MADEGIKFTLPTEIPLDIYPSPEEFIAEAKKLVSELEELGVHIRVMGGLGIYLLIEGTDLLEKWRSLKRLGARVFTDIDFAAYGKDRDKILNFLTMERDNHLYLVYEPSLYFYGGRRYIFYGSPKGGKVKGRDIARIPMVEFFFDELRMNHIIPFKGRLELGKYSLSPTDLLLSKLQIVKINEKDIKDVLTLFLGFEVGDGDKDMINGRYISKLFANDWGFYYTAVNNLSKVKESLLNKYASVFDEGERMTIISNIDRLLRMIEEEPKSFKWKLRAKVGPKRKWYSDVDEW